MGDPRLGDLEVERLHLDADEVAALEDGGDAGRARAAVGMEDDASGGADEAYQPPHQLDGLHAGMGVPRVAAGTSVWEEVERAGRQPLAAGVALAAAGLWRVEEAARRDPVPRAA